MPELDATQQKKIGRDTALVEKFITVYCRKHHGDTGLCEECRDLLEYARERRERCPYDPKPACKDCRTHCYRPAYRERMKAVMRFSGMYFAKRGRLDWLVRYFWNRKK